MEGMTEDEVRYAAHTIEVTFQVAEQQAARASRVDVV